MNIHLPAILMFTRGTRFWHTAIWDKPCYMIHGWWRGSPSWDDLGIGTTMGPWAATTRLWAGWNKKARLRLCSDHFYSMRLLYFLIYDMKMTWYDTERQIWGLEDHPLDGQYGFHDVPFFLLKAWPFQYVTVSSEFWVKPPWIKGMSCPMGCDPPIFRPTHLQTLQTCLVGGDWNHGILFSHSAVFF
jgi:hypothetical protein